MKEHIGFIKDDNRVRPIEPGEPQDLQVDLKPVSRPADFLRNPISALPVEDVYLRLTILIGRVRYL